MVTVKEYFEQMPAAFQKSAAAGLDAVFQFDITGDGGGQWYAEITGGELKVAEGRHDAPGVTISATSADYLAVAEGRINGMVAMGTGKLKLKGNMGLAMKLQSLFKRRAGT